MRDSLAHERWHACVSSLCRALGWTGVKPIVRPHVSGTLLAFASPRDFLFTATEINEWAWEQASGYFALGYVGAINPPFDQLHVPGSDFEEVAEIFAVNALAERNPLLVALGAAALQHGVPMLVDDTDVSLGAGAGSQTWPLDALPVAECVAWLTLRDIPKVLVTGSNGKTTTVRLLAAMLNASDAKYQGHIGYSSTEGVVIGGLPAGEGDFSGPAGARLVLRDIRVEAAVLETARGGILRRGLAVENADVAIVTNISADHFGEYGIDSLDDLADVKLVVRHALGTNGTLVLNADDPVLLARAPDQVCKVALFAFDDAHPALMAHRMAGGATCGLVKEQLYLSHKGNRHSLGNLLEMPLMLKGAAKFNIGNIAAVALAASALRVLPTVIAAQLRCFGSSRQDNPGRLGYWKLANITVLVDYAHNPDGLMLLMSGIQGIRMQQMLETGVEARIGLLLGQAGNRSDEAIAELARVAAIAKPDFIIVKDIANMLRGRAPSEVSSLLESGLRSAGYPAEQIHFVAEEVDAARQLLRWARLGDILVLPIHQSASRKVLSAILDQMESESWHAGAALPSARIGDVFAET